MKQGKEVLIGLKKARTHIDNVIKMTEEEKYCVDILQQNLAIIGLLKAANRKILAHHLKSCFANAMQGVNEKRKRKMIEEILTINKMNS